MLKKKCGLSNLKFCYYPVAQHLRQVGVVGKFVEFFGPGVAQLSIADRATIANMCPEYGATAAFFPVDEVSIKYLVQTGKCRTLRTEGPLYSSEKADNRSATFCLCPSIKQWRHHPKEEKGRDGGEGQAANYTRDKIGFWDLEVATEPLTDLVLNF